MNTLALLIALGCSAPDAGEFAPHIEAYAPEWGIPVELAAVVLFSESTCRKNARGLRGELGGWQLKRGPITTGKARYTDRQLMQPRLSTWLAMRRLARAREACSAEADVDFKSAFIWVGGYAGFRCGPSPYGRKLKARLQKVLPEELR
jgi:hypothetical protein